MRISDWSSDVCSSDLLHLVLDDLGGPVAVTAEQPGRADAEGAGNHQQLVGAGLGTVVFPALPGRRLHAEPAGRLRDRESGRFTRPPNAAAHGVLLGAWTDGKIGRASCRGRVGPAGLN